MNRQDNMRDTHVKNIRLNSPLGLLGVPPDINFSGAGFDFESANVYYRNKIIYEGALP